MNKPIHAVLFGTAVGDSLGLPAENLSPQQVQRHWPGPWSHHFVFGKGMVSDDTEHTVFVAQCLAKSPSDSTDFQRKLAWKLRWWLFCLPAGIGFATLRSTLKLWLGSSPSHSGVFSAGNGPAMRSAIIGAYFAGDIPRIREYVSASTRLTHTDPRAETAALAIALTVSWAITTNQPLASSLEEIRGLWVSAGPDDVEWVGLVQKVFHVYDHQLTVSEFVQELGLKKGVTGYAYHTGSVALYAWLRHFGDFRAGLEAVLNCGGDTDSVGAITGALLAITSDIPAEWSRGLCDYPISCQYLERLSAVLETRLDKSTQLPSFHWIALPFRNLVFLIIVLGHVCRRLIS